MPTKKEEIEKRIEEIKSQIAKNNLVIEQKDILQQAYKLCINGLYGSINSHSNPLGDDDLGNAITTMSSVSIQKMNDLGRKFVKMVRERNGCTNPIDEKRIVVFNDTDSLGLDFSNTGVKLFDGQKVTKEGYDLVQEADDYFAREFPKWYEETTNSHNCCLYFKREKICDVGLYLNKLNKDEEAKKNYVLHILDNEGVKHPKFKYTGVKFARAVMPKILKEKGKKIVETLMLTRDRAKVDKLIQDLYKYYCEMPIDDRCELKRCNNIEKWIKPNMPEGFDTRTPGHIRTVLRYNKIIKEHNFTNLQPVRSGDMVKLVFIKKSRKYDFDKICYLDEWPKEFDDLFDIDYQTGFEKIIYEELKRFYQTLGWPTFNPTLNFSNNLYDILGLN